jgi:hypothetical protein
MPSLNTGITQVVPEQFASTATLMVNFFRTLGGSVGIGVIGLLLEPSLGYTNDINSSKALIFQSAFLALTISFLPALIAWFWVRPNRLPFASDSSIK